MDTKEICSVWVENLPCEWNDIDIIDLFSSAASIKKDRANKDIVKKYFGDDGKFTGKCVIAFNSHTDAMDVIAMLDGARAGANTIHVELAIPKARTDDGDKKAESGNAMTVEETGNRNHIGDDTTGQDSAWRHANDWTCTNCGNVNWDWRQSCNKCGNLKPNAAFGGDGEGPYDKSGSKRSEKLREEEERRQREQDRKARGEVDADLGRVQRKSKKTMPLVTSSWQMPTLFGSIDNPIIPEIADDEESTPKIETKPVTSTPAPVPSKPAVVEEVKPRERERERSNRDDDRERDRDRGRERDSRDRYRDSRRRSRSRSRDRRR